MSEKSYGYLYQDPNTYRYYVKLPDGRIHGYLTVGRKCEVMVGNRWVHTKLAYDEVCDFYYLEGFFDVILPQGIPIRL